MEQPGYPDLTFIRRFVEEPLRAAGYMVDPVLLRDDWGGAGLGWVRRSGKRAHRIQICHGNHANEIVITDRLEPAGGALAPGLEQNCLVTEWQDRILARVEEIIRAAEQAMGQPACD